MVPGPVPAEWSLQTGGPYVRIQVVFKTGLLYIDVCGGSRVHRSVRSRTLWLKYQVGKDA